MIWRSLFLTVLFLNFSALAGELKLSGNMTQGGLVVGWAAPGAQIKLDGKTINLGKGEASLSSLAGATVRLNFVPPFQKFDKVPAPNQVTPQMKEMLSPFGDQGLGKKKLECRLQ